LQLVQQAARQHNRGEKIDLKHVAPEGHLRMQAIEPFTLRPFRRDPGILDQRM
jgi:hypothetical protein